MLNDTQDAKINGLAWHLVRADLMTEPLARRTTAAARKNLSTFTSECIRNELVDPDVLAGFLTVFFGLPRLDLDCCRPLLDPASVLSCELLDKYVVLPMAVRDNRLVVAVSDPSQVQAFQEIEFQTGRSMDLVIAPHHQLRAAIKRVAEGKTVCPQPQRKQSGPVTEPEKVVRAARALSPTVTEPSDAPVIRMVNRLLVDAIRQQASDIHIEPYEKFCRVRIRVDGVLRELAGPPISAAGRLIARLKIMAHLDISERRVPQDGRIRLPLADRPAVDFRISTLPTLWGEKAVLRILDPLRAELQLNQLGLTPRQLEDVEAALGRPQGLILVTGPTGSGKTLTLYSALATLNDSRRNISTAEDPVEINLPGVNQVQIRPAVGLSFAAALRAFLRQDPDVIMVGEIRDRETVEIAIKAAQTGHLVLSTLHTNGATETLTRLLNMGVEPYNLVSSLSLVIAQRLARRLCENCRKAVPVPPGLQAQYPGLTWPAGLTKVYQASGCDRCHEGYRGRIGIYEAVPISDAISRTIIAGGNSMEIAAQARTAGSPSLRQAAIERMAEGLTSLEEVIRIT